MNPTSVHASSHGTSLCAGATDSNPKNPSFHKLAWLVLKKQKLSMNTVGFVPSFTGGCLLPSQPKLQGSEQVSYSGTSFSSGHEKVNHPNRPV
jgi:hypothetical protein